MIINSAIDNLIRYGRTNPSSSRIQFRKVSLFSGISQFLLAQLGSCNFVINRTGWIKDAQVEQVTDNNGLAAVKVTFPSGILFAFNSSALSAASKQSLAEFANILKEDPTVDVAIIGHTDKVGSYEANQKVSANRAYAVENYLQACGVKPYQFKKVEGVGYSQYNESETPEQNRRVEIFMYASEQMIKNAEAGK